MQGLNKDDKMFIIYTFFTEHSFSSVFVKHDTLYDMPSILCLKMFKYPEHQEDVSGEKPQVTIDKANLICRVALTLFTQEPSFSSFLAYHRLFCLNMALQWAHHPYIKVPLVHCHSGNHGRHAVAPKAVPQHRRQHGVPVGNMGAVLL